MVKLLKLCVDYGTDHILDIKASLPKDVRPSIDLVRSALSPEKDSLTIEQDIEMQSIDLTQYDKRFGVMK